MDILQELLLDMAGRAEGVLRIAVDGFAERDATAVDRARAADDVIDRLEVRVDARAMELLALQQPMATDLRRIVAAVKISNDLERVGDHSVNIAKSVARMAGASAHPLPPEIGEMAVHAKEMLADALLAYGSGDTILARTVCRRDDVVDELRHRVHARALDEVLQGERIIAAAVESILVAQNLERIADLATNISEDVVFLVEGLDIKHRAETWESAAG